MVSTETLPQIENPVLFSSGCNFRRAVYLFVERTVRQEKELGWASPGLLDPGTHLRTWGAPTELRQPLQQLRFIASLTCRRSI
jgi:hypothetical protein